MNICGLTLSTPQKLRTAKVLALVVTLSGLLVILGWIFDLRIFKSILPDWPVMKFDTAVAFVVSGISLYFIARSQEDGFDQAQIVLSITSLVLFLMMGTLLFSALFGIKTGAEELFITETPGGVHSIAPGMPSTPTLVSFILIAIAGLGTLVRLGKVPPQLKIIAWAVGLIGTLAVAGYLLNVPLLFYFIENVNSAMAFHTALLFVLLWAGLLCLSD